MSLYRRKSNRIGSLASALEEERLELAEEFEKSRNVASPRNQSSSARHLLDIAPAPGALPPRHGSIAGIGVGVTPPSTRLNWPDPPPTAALLRANNTSSGTPSPTSPEKPSSHSATTTTRRFSDHSACEKKKKVTDSKADNPDSTNNTTTSTTPTTNNNPNNKPRPSIRWDDSVAMSPSATYGIPRRINKPPEKSSNKALQGRNAMAAVMSGLDLRVGLPSFTRGRDSGRNSPTRGTSLDSRLPASRTGRSSPPRNRWLSPNSRNSTLNLGKSTPNKEKPAEIENTDKPQSKPGSRRSSCSDVEGKLPTPSDERLEKDMYDSENNPIETSDEELDDSSSSDDEPATERGRKSTVGGTETGTGKAGSPSGETEEKECAEEKSDFLHSSKQGPIPKRPDVHPRTSYDAASAPTTPFGSDDEAELSDIKRAQQLGIQMSAIDSSVHSRSIRTIIRGDYAHLSEETEGGRRRQRKYMVATDLSEESVYALEWTIGTILRDGDTMFAICAIHEEDPRPKRRPEKNDSATNLSRALLGRLGTGTDSKPGSVDSRGMSKAESERVHAVEVISQTCVRLLRKTLLQVRVAVEVIHCKSPRHMITEAIDGLDPTLVIVGARGRSALKGVLLGSFSNYLVMHSSVPVMVARRKLKKQSKNKKTNIRLSNNLLAPKKLAFAKVD
ncbi:universal stress protein family domain protein [Aspergillus tanneri]|uniref:UspA domain-containing protein n=1 Tax=Aspergillus tanneri TaxID=1220188 RepID=A0A5M9MI79_9EURO|nr:uncharacterized protein ATNIH1004_008368 [Aspergillus tanneri]KAA8644169.1 hypothetical protein ATNIH1004_008368 [Aspergillus tanneri]